jgi:peptidoglycan hydrolase-like protein with peptidoglycan-binding domain
MLFTPTLSRLLTNTGADDIVLRKTSPAGQIRCLQALLYALGFGGSMNWPVYRADGDYGGGTTRALQAFLQANELPGDGSSVSAAQLTALLDAYDRLLAARQASGGQQPVGLGPDWASTRLESEPDTAADEQVATAANGYRAGDFWVTVKLRPHKAGVYNVGDELPHDFIESQESRLLGAGLSASAVRVITPVSANEGNLNGINTWDNCFLTFGMFQWTMGQGGGAGELPALLQRLQEDDPATFGQYFGAYGIGLADTNRTTGYLTLNGQKISSTTAKEQFRARADWAFRFWRSGLDPAMQLAQVKHALDRINSFLRHPDYQPLGKYFIGDLVTSEYGLCLLLDHHVNRPGHLMNYAIGKMDIVGQALKKAGLEHSDPKAWDTATERRLIEAYLPLRASSSMTHGADRARKIKAYHDKGKLSGERHSFMMQATRSLSAPPAPEAYPRVDWAEYEERGGWVE